MHAVCLAHAACIRRCLLMFAWCFFCIMGMIGQQYRRCWWEHVGTAEHRRQTTAAEHKDLLQSRSPPSASANTMPIGRHICAVLTLASYLLLLEPAIRPPRLELYMRMRMIWLLGIITPILTKHRHHQFFSLCYATTLIPPSSAANLIHMWPRIRAVTHWLVALSD